MPHFFGQLLRAARPSLDSVYIVEPTLGLDVAQASVGVPLGATPNSDNYIMREGAIEPRPMLSLRGTSSQPMGAIQIMGGAEISDVSGNRFPLISGTTRLAWYSTGSWSALSYVSAAGINQAPNGGTADYWDITQIYYDRRDENIAVLANNSYNTLYCWQSSTTVFSTLTGAPEARSVTAFDNYLLAFNVLDPGSNQSAFVQRVQWSDRGSASSWTGGLSGFEDLLAMRGYGTRIMTLENRIILFSDQETWQGFPVDFPFVFRFQPLDTGVGCPYPWTAAVTPLGIMFLSKDFHIYLLSKDGGAPQPISQHMHRFLRNNIDRPERAWAAYDHTFNQYQLYYPIKGGSGYPQRAVYLTSPGFGYLQRVAFRNVEEGSWAPQSFDRPAGNLSLSRGFEAQYSSSATTWGAMGNVRWGDLTLSWGQLGGSSELRSVYVGSSNGTMYYLNSQATSDNGTAVQSYWRSTALEGQVADRQKVLNELRIDYAADSSSSLTVQVSTNQGASFGAGTTANLPSNSALSQAIAYPYVASRYPMFQVSSEAQRYRLFRFYAKLRTLGR